MKCARLKMQIALSAHERERNLFPHHERGDATGNRRQGMTLEYSGRLRLDVFLHLSDRLCFQCVWRTKRGVRILQIHDLVRLDLMIQFPTQLYGVYNIHYQKAGQLNLYEVLRLKLLLAGCRVEGLLNQTPLEKLVPSLLSVQRDEEAALLQGRILTTRSQRETDN